MKKIIYFIVEGFLVFLFIFILLKYVEINSIKIWSLSFSSLLYSTITAIILVFSFKIIKKTREDVRKKIINSGLTKEKAELRSLLITGVLFLLIAQIGSMLVRSGLNINPLPYEVIFKSQEIYVYLFLCVIINFFGLIFLLLLVKKAKYIDL
jgi:hypothetical protein